MPPDPLEARASGPSVYRYTRLLYHENPPTSKFNETPGMTLFNCNHSFLVEIVV